MDITFGFYDTTSQKGITNAAGQIVQSNISGVVATYPISQTATIQNIDLSPANSFSFQIAGYNTVTKTGADLANLTASDVGDLYPVIILSISEKNKIATLGLLGAGMLFLLSADKKKKDVNVVGKLETKNVVPYLVIGGGLLAFGFLNKIITGVENLFGLSKSQSQQNVEDQENNPLSFWNGNFWQKYTSFPHSTLVNDDELAGEKLFAIEDSFGILSDDFNTIFGTFKTFTSQSDLSYVAYKLQQEYGQDFLTYLQGTSWPNDRLSDDQINQVTAYFNGLPTN